MVLGGVVRRWRVGLETRVLRSRGRGRRLCPHQGRCHDVASKVRSTHRIAWRRVLGDGRRGARADREGKRPLLPPRVHRSRSTRHDAARMDREPAYFSAAKTPERPPLRARDHDQVHRLGKIRRAKPSHARRTTRGTAEAEARGLRGGARAPSTSRSDSARAGLCGPGRRHRPGAGAVDQGAATTARRAPAPLPSRAARPSSRSAERDRAVVPRQRRARASIGAAVAVAVAAQESPRQAGVYPKPRNSGA